jgi:uncharacterized peroxidase-related enzyme
MAHIRVIEPEEASGELKATYDDLAAKRGKLAEVHKVQSLHPETIVQHMDLYMELMYGSSPLTRAQREMLGVVVSAENGCEYCQEHHGAALERYWKDAEAVLQLRKQRDASGLSNAERELCALAVELTRDPASSTAQRIDTLKRTGLSDRAVLDATMIIAYFNFVNRIVLGLGVELEEDRGRGYRYDSTDTG